MKITDIIVEGGWDTTLTQGTVLHPRIVQQALLVVDKFVQDFNQYLQTNGVEGQVKRGRPTGSSAYYAKDMVSVLTSGVLGGRVQKLITAMLFILELFHFSK